MSNVALSVIIPVSRPAAFLQCVAGFAKQQTTYGFEIIAVGLVETIGPVPSFVKLVPMANPHPNARRNAGVKQACAALIALMDDDAVPLPNWVRVALEQAKLQPGKVLTGPEVPPSNAARFSIITHQILSSGAAELTQIHVNTSYTKVKWYEVPFCNCVFEKKMWQLVNGFSETIPWHMDDFHFFYQYRYQKEFINVPLLCIQHNRYPATLAALIQYKWKLRKETGGKLITHPQIYFRVWPVVLALLAPMAGVVFALVMAFTFPQGLMLLLPAYMAFTLTVTLKSSISKTITAIGQGATILIAVQILTVAAIYVGFFTALWQKCGRSKIQQQL